MTKMLELSLLYVIFPENLAIKGTLVGSRAQGCSGYNSDWDYIFLEDYKDEILNYLRFNEISFTTDGKTGNIKFFVMLVGISFAVNLIFVPNIKNYDAWIKATEVLKIVGDAFTTKQNRIKVFCDLVVYFGGEPSKYPNFCS